MKPHSPSSTTSFPDYLSIETGQLGSGSSIDVHIVPDSAALAERMAQAMRDAVVEASVLGKPATLIIPVGPVDQYAPLIREVNRSRLSLADVLFIGMDEYLADDGTWIPSEHPLSFRGFLDRAFFAALDADLAPRPENRLIPDPSDLGAIERRIDERGGVDVCFAGVGINGHLAFNEPPEPGEVVSVEEFAARGTRTLSLARETRTINAVTVGGDPTCIPTKAVTVGMKEILSSRQIWVACQRPWQKGVVRRLLHGPITASFPATLLRRHPKVTLTMTAEVAERPDVRLR